MSDLVRNTYARSGGQVLLVSRKSVRLLEANSYNTNPGLLHTILTVVLKELSDVCSGDRCSDSEDAKLRLTTYSDFVIRLGELGKLTANPVRREDMDAHIKKVVCQTKAMAAEFEALMRLHGFSEIVGLTEEMTWILSSFGFKIKF